MLGKIIATQTRFYSFVLLPNLPVAVTIVIECISHHNATNGQEVTMGSTGIT